MSIALAMGCVFSTFAGGSSSGGAGGSGAGGSGAGGASSAASGGSQTDLLTRKLLVQLLASKKTARSKKAKSGYSKKARAAYNSVKKQKTKELNATKNRELSIGRAAIKRLPKKQQTAARKQLNAKIKDKYDRLKAKIPSATGKTPAELVSLMRRLRTLRV